MKIYVRKRNVTSGEIQEAKEKIEETINHDPFLRERIDKDELILDFQKDPKIDRAHFLSTFDVKPSGTEKG